MLISFNFIHATMIAARSAFNFKRKVQNVDASVQEAVEMFFQIIFL